MLLITKIRKEYAKLQQENNQLKIEMQKYKSYIDRSSQKNYRLNYQKPIKKGNIIMIKKVMMKAKRVILILQKLELKNKKGKEKFMKTK